jgi:hypothetical protein
MAAGAFALLCLALPAAGQTPLHASTGSADGDLHGAALADAGDVDGDGTTDLIIGAPAGNYARVVSGLDGSQIHRVLGPAGPDLFGTSVIGVGDVNDDGHADFVVGAPGSVPGDGSVILYSGLEGGLLLDLTVLPGVDPWPAGGTALATVGDLDADGTTEFLAGAPDLGGVGTGNVFILRYDVVDVVHGTLGGVSAGDQFGFDVASAGDVDADGVPDIIVGTGAGGYARVYSGATLTLLHHLTGPGGGYGRVVAGIGDVDGDGHDDVAVSAPGLNFVDILSGDTGTLLRRFDALAGDFGSSLAPMGDLDGDGVPDLAVGVPDEAALGVPGAGSSVILSGASGEQLFKFIGNVENARAGIALAALADPDGDGKRELAIGATGEGGPGLPMAGRAAVYPGFLAGLIRPYGFGCPDSFLITPSIEMIGDPTAAGEITLSITRGFPGSTAFVFIGTGQGVLPLSNGCILWVDPLLPPIMQLPLGGVFPGSGQVLVTGLLPHSLPAGTVLTFQAFEPVLDSPGEIASTGAVQITTF